MGDFIELKCQRCGGRLQYKGGDMYICESCEKQYAKRSAEDIESKLCGILNAQKQEAVANLRQLLWKETHEEFISNKEVERICKEILMYLPEDFYANFYLTTCKKSKSALGAFLGRVDTDVHYDDIPDLLDYILKSLKPEWTMCTGNFIERAFKGNDLKLYHKYRTWFDSENAKNDECVYQTDFPRNVFVAYSSKDMAKVEELVGVLEEELTCFVAVRNLRHGSGAVENYEQALRDAIDHCAVLVFVSSDNSRSLNCDAYKELGYIEKYRKDMPRVEYLIKDYGKRPSELFFKKFFEGLEYCVSPQDVAGRVCNIIMGGEKQAEPVTVANAAPAANAADYTKRLKRIGILISAGKFDGIADSLDALESECENIADDSLLAEIYYNKMLAEYKARNDGEVVDLLLKNGQNIAYNTNYCLAEGYAKGSNEILLNKLHSIKTRAEEGIKQAVNGEEKPSTSYTIQDKQQAEKDYKAGLSYEKNQDYAEAVKWYRKAAEQGHAGAQNHLGICYDFAHGVTRNYAEAAKWYKKSAIQGHSDSQFRLGYFYEFYDFGEGTPPNYTEAVKWYRKAAEQGDFNAQNRLGICYDFAHGVTRNYTEAAKWYKKSAIQGHSDSQFRLGYFYEFYDFGEGTPPNYTEAVKWYRKAAEQGDFNAQYYLGLCYQNGKGIAKNYAEAVKWYRKAAEQGHAGAQNNLGYCYKYGQGIAQDYEEAVKWYRKAAEQGLASAQNNLGWCYENGQGVAKDYAEAVKWYRKADQQGKK